MAKETVLSCVTKRTAVCVGMCCTGGKNFCYRVYWRNVSVNIHSGADAEISSHAATDSTVVLNDFTGADKVLYRLRLHRPQTGNRRSGQHRLAAASVGSVYQHAFSVL